MSEDLKKIHQQDQGQAAVEQVATTLGMFRASLIEQGFTPEAAEEILKTWWSSYLMGQNMKTSFGNLFKGQGGK